MIETIDKETLKVLQKKSLEMAEYFVDFCQKNNLLCYLCGGGCIGAVREKGFVEWDDDLDFFMPRPHYEKLIEIWNTKADSEKYYLQVSSKDVITKNQFATICDNSTTYIKTFMKDLDINHGLSLDIIPLDARPKKDGMYSIRRKIQIIRALVYSVCIIGEAPTNHGGLVKAMGKIFLFFVHGNKMRYKLYNRAERKMMKYDYSSAEYICELTTGPVFMKRDYPADMFKSAVMLPFEDTQMPVPVKYHEYLTMAFGDYMTPPPESERAFHHDFEYIDMEQSYKSYKGIYYCKDCKTKEVEK